MYQDVNLRSYFGSIRPPTRLTFGFQVYYSTFSQKNIHSFLSSPSNTTTKTTRKIQTGWWTLGKVGPIGCLHSSGGTEKERNGVRGRGAGKRVESIGRKKQNEIRIWPKKKQRYGYHDRSPSIKKNLSKSLRLKAPSSIRNTLGL